MASLLIGLLTLACVVAGLTVGMSLRTRLPGHHLQDDSKEVVKTAAGLIATLVALVIGLLVGSAKTSLDATSSGLTQAGAKFLSLDRILVRYGPEAEPVRVQLRGMIRAVIDRMWPTHAEAAPDFHSVESSMVMEDIDDQIRALPARNESQRQLQAQALQLTGELLLSRWMLVEQGQAELPLVFLVVLIFWLTILFMSFGLLAPRNATSVCTLLICAVSISGAVFLILEMNNPFEGIIRVSSAPLEKALSVMKP